MIADICIAAGIVAMFSTVGAVTGAALSVHEFRTHDDNARRALVGGAICAAFGASIGLLSAGWVLS